MIYKSQSDYYQLVRPKSWEIEEDENTISIYDAINGVGAINITSYLIPKDYQFDVKKELIEFVDREDIPQNSIKTTFADHKKIASLELAIEDQYWRYYVLFCNHKALFITYNCRAVDKNKELDEVSQIVESILVN